MRTIKLVGTTHQARNVGDGNLQIGYIMNLKDGGK